jgi:hypothetical protein
MRSVPGVLIEHVTAAGGLNFDNSVVEDMRPANAALVVEHNWDFILPAATVYVAALIHAVAPVSSGVGACGVAVPELDAPVIQPARFQYVGNFYRRLIVIPCPVE